MWTAIAVALLGVVALVLFTPVEVTFRCERQPSSTFRCRVGSVSLFGLVEVGTGSSGQPVEDVKRREGAARKRRQRRKPRRPKHVLEMLMTNGFLPGVTRLSVRLGRALRARDLYVWLRAGFDDPADTGLLCAWMMPAGAYLTAHQPGQWDVAPVFSSASPVFALSMRARVRVTLARLLWPLILFGLTPSTVRGFIALASGRAS